MPVKKFEVFFYNLWTSVKEIHVLPSLIFTLYDTQYYEDEEVEEVYPGYDSYSVAIGWLIFQFHLTINIEQ